MSLKTLKDYEPQALAANRMLVSMPQDIPGLNLGYEPAGVGLVRGTSSSMVNKPDDGVHPWKVSGTGTADLNVGAGMILGSRSGDVGGGVGPVYSAYVSFAGTDVTISGPSWIYAYVSTSATQLFDGGATTIGQIVTQTLKPVAPVSVVVSGDDPDTIADGSDGEYWFAVAEVDLVDGVAVVVEQILTCNPLLNSEYVEVLA
jgi:hypothetical protein